MVSSELLKEVAEAHKKSINTLEELTTGIPILIAANEKQWAIHQTAEYIKDKFHIKTYRDNHIMLEYKDGMYVNNAEPLVLSEVQASWKFNATTHIASEVVDHIKRGSFIDRDDFNKPGLICLKNGILNINTLELLPHSPDYLFNYMLPVEYKPEADCPKIKEFIKQIVKPEDYQTIFEMIGYCLYPRNIMEKCFMLHGVGSNGKSTLVNVIKSLLGSGNIVSISLQELTENRYAAGWLYGKLANIHSDLSRKAIKDSGVFKLTTSGDPVTVDAKYNPNGMTFTPTAKQIYSANQLPLVYDDSDAFYRRWIVIDFPNIFTPDKMDRQLAVKLTTPEELSGLLNESVKALHAVLASNDFTSKKTTDEWRTLYTRLSDPIGSFAMDCIQTGSVGDGEFRTPKGIIYDTYVLYCKMNQMPMKSPIWFWRGFRERITFSESHSQELGVWVDYLLGLKLNEGYINSNIYNRDIHGSDYKKFKKFDENCEKGLSLRAYRVVSPYCSRVYKKICKEKKDNGEYASLKNEKTAIFDEKTSKINTVLEIIEKCGENGINLMDLMILLSDYEETELNLIINELKTKGLIFENPAGTFRKVF